MGIVDEKIQTILFKEKKKAFKLKLHHTSHFKFHIAKAKEGKKFLIVLQTKEKWCDEYIYIYIFLL